MEFPRTEERGPVDEFAVEQFAHGGGEGAGAEKLGLGNVEGGPVGFERAGAGLGEREEGAAFTAVGEIRAGFFLFGADVGDVGGFVVGTEELRDDADDARGVEHVDDGLGVVWGDLDRVVRGGGGGTAD